MALKYKESVTGDALYSPLVFVGYGADWRDLMEEFADANVEKVGTPEFPYYKREE